MQGNTPKPGSKQYIKNEKTIVNNPKLRQARDTAEGLAKPPGRYTGAGGKGSSRRPENKAAYDANFDRIFGKKD